MREASLPPDWLTQEFAEISSDYAMSFSPSWLRAYGGLEGAPVQPMLEPHDAARLREKMTARYREWTGRDLAADFALAEQEKRHG